MYLTVTVITYIGFLEFTEINNFFTLMTNIIVPYNSVTVV